MKCYCYETDTAFVFCVEDAENKNLNDFDGARKVFYEYFDKDNFPARMTSQTEFLDADCLCMIDGVAYKPEK